MPLGTTARRLDPLLAVAAGERCWIDGDDEVDGPSRLTAAVEIVGLLVAITVPLGRVPDRLATTSQPWAIWVPVWLSIVAGTLFAYPTIELLLRGRRRTEFLGVALARRGIAAVTLVGALVALCPGWRVLTLWPLGIVLGCDATRTAWLLGSMQPPSRWWRSFLVSPVHLGVVGAFLAGALRRYALSTILRTYLAMHVTVAIGVVLSVVLENMRSRWAADAKRSHADGEASAFRATANWLHDEVSSRIRAVRLRLETATMTESEMREALDGVDHEMRLLQIDQTVRTGRVRANDIVQVYIRQAQARGATITQWPSREESLSELSPETGRQLQRAAAVLTANALNAGATHLGFALVNDDRHIVIEVSDDAGGFSWSDVPDGRGLSRLGDELGPGSITVRPVPNGSVVAATVQLRSEER